MIIFGSVLMIELEKNETVETDDDYIAEVVC